MTKQLVQVMEALTKVHQQLNQQAKRKEQAIIQGDMAELEDVMKAESPLIQQLRKLENTRLYLVKNWKEANGIFKEDATMDELLPHFEESVRSELSYWSDQLVSEVRALQVQNERNQLLINDSLKFVNMSLDLMTVGNETYAGYSGTGEAADDAEADAGPVRSLFDSKA
ncbi:flagellar protein FlgN [Salisediminibacterium halotolerans]|uniref:FlgN protein n=1 Tax=Salisediminibacterium halotolerans TaxID=517425 RepID=A0A1H9TSD5_9BACI|nr:flagellar protein FlgN [Salisediminibacterium haloalkalitolerans]SES00145.1 FlgN protein [Salisediminibacterium haloalkalitolerans]